MLKTTTEEQQSFNEFHVTSCTVVLSTQLAKIIVYNYIYIKEISKNRREMMKVTKHQDSRRSRDHIHTIIITNVIYLNTA